MYMGAGIEDRPGPSAQGRTEYKQPQSEGRPQQTHGLGPVFRGGNIRQISLGRADIGLCDP